MDGDAGATIVSHHRGPYRIAGTGLVRVHGSFADRDARRRCGFAMWSID
jgi:hypothetical protein